MNSAGACIERDMIAPDDAPGTFENGTGVGDAVELAALHRDRLPARFDDSIALPAGGLSDRLNHLAGEQHEFALRLDEAVVDLGTEGHGRVRGKGPGRSGPDENVGGFGVNAGVHELLRHLVQLEVHVDRRRRLVGVLDLRFGQSRMAVLAPMDGLAAAIDRAVQVELLEDLHIG